MTQAFGSATYYNECWNNVPNLHYICGDSNEITALQSFLVGCGVTQAITIDSACPLAVAEFDEEQVTVYPNPTKGMIQFDNSKTLFTSVGVYDYLGQEIINAFDCSQDETPIIDLSELSNGIYLVKLTGKDRTFTTKIIKE